MEVGNIVLSAMSDGRFVARPGYFGDDATAEGHGDLFDRRGQAWLRLVEIENGSSAGSPTPTSP